MTERPYAVDFWSWLHVDADDLMLFVPMWLGTLAGLAWMLGVPVERIIKLMGG